MSVSKKQITEREARKWTYIGWFVLPFLLMGLIVVFQNGKWVSLGTSKQMIDGSQLDGAMSVVEEPTEQQMGGNEMNGESAIDVEIPEAKDVIGIDLVHEAMVDGHTIRLDTVKPGASAVQTFALAIQTDKPIRLQTAVDESNLSEIEKEELDGLMVDITLPVSDDSIFDGKLMDLADSPLLLDLPANVEGETIVEITVKVYLPADFRSTDLVGPLKANFMWSIIEEE